MAEINRKQCKICKEYKERIFTGKFPNNKDKKWAQSDGLLWNGRECGTCNQSRSLQVMRKIRSAKPD